MRDVRATLDVPGETDTTATENGESPEGSTVSDPTSVVVACPPHPEHGGRRTDVRLRTVGNWLCSAGIACLRFDYGPWADGDGELRDARNALEWASDRYERVGLFGYSFGAAIAVCAARESRTDDIESGGPPARTATGSSLGAVSALAPAARISGGLDVVAALEDVACPVQVVVGERDTTVDWEPVVERARELEWDVVRIGADHHFVGQTDTVADAVGPFLRRPLMSKPF